LRAADDFLDNSLDFVYIDAGHRFDDVVQDIIKWTKKVRKGGIISGHDYMEYLNEYA
jgi:predicted O-methyltransferase YrrM